MNKVIPFFLFLSACGAKEMSYKYQTDCFSDIQSERTINLENFKENEKLLVTLFKSQGIVDSKQDFCQKFGDIPIRIYSAETIPHDPDLSGKATYNVGIELAGDGWALAHELLHMWDINHIAIGTSWHEGWNNNGYEALSKRFAQNALSI